MNIFLKFKNKKIESLFYNNLDSYTAHMMITHTSLSIAGLPTVLINQYFLTERNWMKHFKRGMQWISFFTVLLLLGILARIFRSRLEKHKAIVRWVLDLFYTGLSGFLLDIVWEAMNQQGATNVRYIVGWEHCLFYLVTLSIISRWYLKVAAFSAVIMRLAIGAYINTGQLAFISTMCGIIVFTSLNTYFQERNEKNRFIEKYKLHTETLIFKEVLSQITEGIIISDLEGNIQFRNLSDGKFSWWDAAHTFQENLGQIQVEHQINLLTQNSDAVIHIETESNEFTTFSEVFERLTRALKSNEHFFDQSDHQMQNLMIANARVTNKATNLNQMLEIRVMWLIYQEMPSLALIFTDITERNLVVQLQDTNDYKNRLLASVSHELRTPLNASLNFIQAAIEDPQIPIHISEDFLAPSLTSNQLLLHLINDILDFSQMSANKLRLTYEKCDVGKTLGDCVNLMKLQASKKGLELLLEFDCETLDSEFITDHTRLKQIILNLLSNAVKFTLHGMIKVKAVLSNSMEKGKILKVEVSDTGIGISEENQKKLFKSFEKVDLGEQAFLNSTGVGLGLVISSNLVLMLGPEEKNNGIKIKSRENEGTTFSFWIVNKELSSKSKLDISYRSENYNNQMDELDVQRDTQPFETQANLISLGSPSTRRHLLPVKMHPLLNNQINPGISQRCTCPSVLIVDDDVFNITALSMILQQLGQTCDRAYNGQQAIEKIFERQEVKCGPSCQQYKLIFMDYSMPIMDGFEATRKLKQLMSSWELPLITIIGCTAFVQEKELKRGIEAGMDGYCIKPLNKCKIGAILTKLAH